MRITAPHMEVKAYFNKAQAEGIARGQEARVFEDLPGTVL